MELREWVNQELKRRGWSMRELARRSGMSAANLSYVLNGKQEPTFEFCAAIAKPLEEPALMVFQRAGLLPAVPPLEDASLREMVDLMRSLTPDERLQVIDYAKWLRRRNRSQT